MNVLNHWHPLIPSHHVKNTPVAVRLAGRDLVVFRAASGSIGVLDDYCPHRRMKLSLGSVAGDKLRCLYHGWTFDCAGHGESPGTPKLHATCGHYVAREQLGIVWVKPANANPVFPVFEVDGYFNICNLTHSINAPLETTIDNFCEIEHTPTTHAFFGYPLERMREVQVEFHATDTTVRVTNRGPRKQFSPVLRWLLGIGNDWLFLDDWTTHFSPVYSVYDHWWESPDGTRESMVRWRLYIFFVPIDVDNTRLFTFAFTKSRYPGPAGGARLFRWLMRRKLNHEINLDVRILEGLADKRPDLDGMKLSRFDKSLGLNRERLNRVYRGEPARPTLRIAG
jgi:phenylpropionate dioxygenase-like ring-hydroxylating dioxygenase large terminal subunit